MESRQVTYLLLGVFIVVMLVFVGCVVDTGSEKITDAEVEYAPVEDLPVADAADVLEETPEEVYEEPVLEPGDEDLQTVEEKLLEREDELRPVGNRIWGEEEEAQEAEQIESSEVMVYLLADKTMSKSAVEISLGTTLMWKNKDEGYAHVLLIEEGDDRMQTAPRLEPEETFEYTFNKKGEYLVRDMFAGTMRMTVVVS